jgi:hypothetical protein
MAQKEFKGIIVNGEQLTLALWRGKGEDCLDFITGSIVPASECPEGDIGEGRPALKRGKRYIRLPALEEIRQELKARYDNWEQGDYEDNDDLLPQRPEAQEIRELLRPDLDAIGQDPDYQESCDFLHEELAAEEAAQRWIASLRPTVMVGWAEDLLGVLLVYYPDVREWVYAR